MKSKEVVKVSMGYPEGFWVFFILGLLMCLAGVVLISGCRTAEPKENTLKCVMSDATPFGTSVCIAEGE